MNELPAKAAKVAEEITELLGGERIGYLDVLDALATAGLTLTVDETREASRAYASVVEMEGLWAA